MQTFRHSQSKRHELSTLKKFSRFQIFFFSCFLIIPKSKLSRSFLERTKECAKNELNEKSFIFEWQRNWKADSGEVVREGHRELGGRGETGFKEGWRVSYDEKLLMNLPA